MTTLQNICVYCASSNAVDDQYKVLAQDLGTALGEHNKTLIYGGGHVGLMGAVADAALDASSKVIGVIPQYLKDKEVAHDGLTELHITQTMQERQTKMAELSDAFIVLPGGLGTLAEFFEIVTWKQLGLHDKPIFILNAFSYWDHLLAALDHAHDQKFLYQDMQTLCEVVDTLDALTAKLT